MKTRPVFYSYAWSAIGNLACLAVAGLVACPGGVRAEPGVSPAAITFGQTAPLEGPAAAFGVNMRRGILAAFAEVNKSGGIRGRKLELITRNDGYEPGRAVEAVNKLIEEDKIFAIIGSVGTPTAQATLPLTTQTGVPFIAPYTGAAFLRDPSKTGVVNMRASYFEEAEAIVAQLTGDLGITRIAVLYQDDFFGRAALAGVQQALKRRSMSLVSEGTFERNTTAVKRALLQIREGHPEAVILLGAFAASAAFIELAREIKFEAVFVNLSVVEGNALATALGGDGAGVIISQVVPFPGDTSLPAVNRYRAALKAIDPAAEPGFVSLEGYLAGRLLIAALEKIPGEPTRQALLQAIDGGTFDFDGFRLTYNPGGDQGSNEVYLTMIAPDGSIRPISNLSEALSPERKVQLLARRQHTQEVAHP
jgi:ABC-type branched-subunit amino acid transport system substrate-binding protein